MEARLQRAEWFLETGDEAAALSDLEAVLRSHRNFDNIEALAQALLADIVGDRAKPTKHPGATSPPP